VGAGGQQGNIGEAVGHDPEKRSPVCPRDKRKVFARTSCSNKRRDRDPIQGNRILIQTVLAEIKTASDGL
jgi:hypothetical protein